MLYYKGKTNQPRNKMINLPTRKDFTNAGFTIRESFDMTIFVKKESLTGDEAYVWIENMGDIRNDPRFEKVLDMMITPIDVRG